MSVEYLPVGPFDSTPVGADRGGNVLWRVLGDGARIVQSPDGAVQWVEDPYWMTDFGTMLPNGDVVGRAYYKYDSSTRVPGKGVLWRDGELMLLRSRGFADRGMVAADANTSGVFVGWTGYPGPTQAVYWRSLTARPRLIPIPKQYSSSQAMSIDPDGTVYIQAQKTGAPKEWLAWHGDRVRTLPFPSRFTASEVSGGMAAGYITKPDGSQRPAFYGPEGLSVLPIPEGATGQATSVTSHGEWGGYLRDANGQYWPFVGDSTQDVRYLPVQGRTVDVRSFGSVTAVTDGAIVRCVYP